MTAFTVLVAALAGETPSPLGSNSFGPGGAPAEPPIPVVAGDSEEFRHAMRLYEQGRYEQAALVFLKIAAQRPEAREAPVAHEMALRAARLARNVDDTASNAGRVELAVYNGIAATTVGALVGALVGVAADYRSPGPALLLGTLGLAAGIGVTVAATSPGFPQYRAQLTISGALWGGFVPAFAAEIAGGGRGNVWPTVFGIGASAGFLIGEIAGAFVEVDSGILSATNTGGWVGLILGTAVSSILQVSAPGSTYYAGPLLGLVGGGLVGAAVGFALMPRRGQVLLADLGIGTAIMIGSVLTPAFERGVPDRSVAPGLALATGVVAGITLVTAVALFFDRPAAGRLAPVAFVPWSDGGSVGGQVVATF